MDRLGGSAQATVNYGNKHSRKADMNIWAFITNRKLSTPQLAERGDQTPRILYVVLSILLSPCVLFAATHVTIAASFSPTSGITTWGNSYSYTGPGNITGGLGPTSLLATADGGYLVGSTGAYGATILRLDALGSPKWQKLYDCMCTVKSLAPSPGGGYVAAAVADFVDESQIVVLRIGPGGALIWSRIYHRARFDLVETITPTRDGGYLLGGSSSNISSQESMWLVKIGARGAIQWQKRYNVAIATSIQQLSNGDFLIGTRLFSVLRLTSTGLVKWQKKYRRRDCCDLGRMQAMEDGSFYLAGLARFNTKSSVAVVKADADGNPIYSRIYSSANPIELAGARLTSNDGLLVLTDVRFNKSSLFQLDPAGNVQWRMIFVSQGGELSQPQVLQTAPDDGSLFASTNWIFKLDPLGNISGNCSFTESSVPTTVRSFPIKVEKRTPTVAITHAVPTTEPTRTTTLTPIVQPLCSQ